MRIVSLQGAGAGEPEAAAVRGAGAAEGPPGRHRGFLPDSRTRGRGLTEKEAFATKSSYECSGGGFVGDCCRSAAVTQISDGEAAEVPARASWRVPTQTFMHVFMRRLHAAPLFRK